MNNRKMWVQFSPATKGVEVASKSTCKISYWGIQEDPKSSCYLFFSSLHKPIVDWPAEVQGRTRYWIGVYKRVRHLLMGNDYCLLPQPQSEVDWNARQFCNGAGEGLVFVFRWTVATKG